MHPRHIRLALIATLLLAPLVSVCGAQNTQLAKVPVKEISKAVAHKMLRVIDGDAVVVQLDGKETRVRLIGVDMQETVHPSKPVEFFGKEASKHGQAYTKYPFRQDCMDPFSACEREARKNKRGLWSGEAPKVEKQEPAPLAEVSTEVLVTRTGTKYHRAGCRHLSQGKLPLSLDEAKKRYGPCSVCNPPM